MGHFWTLICHLHTLAGPVTMLLYPLYASVVAIETTDKLDDEQWLAYWIFYSFLTLMEMVLQHVLQWIPIWYDVKLIFVAWLVLPQFRGAAFIYDKFVRERIIKKYRESSQAHTSKSKAKFMDFITPKKGNLDQFIYNNYMEQGEHEAYQSATAWNTK